MYVSSHFQRLLIQTRILIQHNIIHETTFHILASFGWDYRRLYPRANSPYSDPHSSSLMAPSTIRA